MMCLKWPVTHDEKTWTINSSAVPSNIIQSDMSAHLCQKKKAWDVDSCDEDIPGDRPDHWIGIWKADRLRRDLGNGVILWGPPGDWSCHRSSHFFRGKIGDIWYILRNHAFKSLKCWNLPKMVNGWKMFRKKKMIANPSRLRWRHTGRCIVT